MAQDIYTKITELVQVSGADLRQNDAFMISRLTGNGTNYVSYRCDYGQLSSAFVSSVVDALSVSGINIEAQHTVQDKNDLEPNGNRLVSEKVIWEISKTATSGAGQKGALLTQNAGLQTVEGPVKFSGKLKCRTNETVEDDDVINHQQLENYISTAGFMPFFKGCAAAGTTTVIKPDSKNDLPGILYKIPADCIAQVILYSTQAYNDFCIFAYCMTCHFGTLDSIYEIAKGEIANSNLPASNYCILQHQPLSAKKAVVVNLPMRKDNILCFLPKGVYNTATGEFEPATGAKIKKNTLTITVKEYRSFATE